MKIYEIQNKGKGIITTLTPSDLLLLNPPTYFINTSTIQVSGEGNSVVPYSLDVVPLTSVQTNPQSVITIGGVITNSDHNKTIFINNGAFPITLTVDTLITTPNFCVGFIQEGTGDVTFVGSGVSLTNPVGLKSKGQGYQTFIERKLDTSTYFLLGNTRA